MWNEASSTCAQSVTLLNGLSDTDKELLKKEVDYGTAMLCVDDSKKLTGNYYTSRSTRGSMMFQAVE